MNPGDQSAFSLARDAIIEEIIDYHGCISGDCPHTKVMDCNRAIMRESADAARAHTLQGNVVKALVEALGELVSILNDSHARKMVDSFTAQPGEAALKAYEQEVSGG